MVQSAEQLLQDSPALQTPLLLQVVPDPEQVTRGRPVDVVHEMAMSEQEAVIEGQEIDPVHEEEQLEGTLQLPEVPEQLHVP